MSGQRVRVKICGMTRLDDALCAVDAGVDALGFIFHPASPRAIAPQEAQAIIRRLPPLVAAVGVLVNEPLTKALRLIEDCGLQYVQLHGAETPEYCRELAQLVPSCRIWKAIRVHEHTTAAELAPYETVVQGFVLDTGHKSGLLGGTGEAFNWSLIERLAVPRPFLLAGGIGPSNIREAITGHRPYGVDANSCLEDAPGRKNHGLIHGFMAAVRAAETELARKEQGIAEAGLL
ncbi:MAG: phosphoribosylanthranilate isomerase [Desulfobulbus sp.]|jgi:phosphoribosylanthranilate isomerase